MAPLSWYIAGPLIGISVAILLLLREKQLGVSSSFRVVGRAFFRNWGYFNYDWKKDLWQVYFVGGILITSLLIFNFTEIGIPEIDASKEYAARTERIYHSSNALYFFAGAFLIGFGARYADGCTAGHCIMGNAQFARSSALTTAFFFIGGLFATYFIVPQIFGS